MFVDTTPSFNLYYLIAIIVAGILFLLLVLLILLLLLCRRRRKRRQATAAQLTAAGADNSAMEKKEMPSYDVIKVNESKIKPDDDDLYLKGKSDWSKDEKVKIVDEMKVSAKEKQNGVQKKAENDYAKIPSHGMGTVRNGSNAAASRGVAATAAVAKPSSENLYVDGPRISQKEAEARGVNAADGVYEHIEESLEEGGTEQGKNVGDGGERASNGDYESLSEYVIKE